MDLSPLVLENVERTREVVAILSELIVHSDRVERVREVFKEEVELGLRFGLAKVTSCIIFFDITNIINLSLVYKWKLHM